MKRVLLILTTVLCMTVPDAVIAQEYTQTPVTVSKEKIRDSDGKVYYSHVVQERQTLFSIATAYGVTVDEICDANKDLDIRNLGLKKNSILRIPVTSAAAQTEEQKAETQKTEPQKTEAQKTETRKKSKASRQDSVQTSDKGDSQDNVEYVTHVVKWYEDINDIATKYNVSVESILKANGLKKKKVKNRQVLKIPVGKAVEEETETAAEAVPETPEEAAEEEAEEDSIFDGIFTRKSTVNAVLMMPLNASGTPSGTNMDFYCGFLLGVKDLGEEEDISTNLSVYDVANGTIPVTTSRLEESDVVIGPVSVADLTKVISLNTGGTPIVSPLDQKAETLADEYSYFIQAPTSYHVQYEDICKWIKSDLRADDKVIVISETDAKDAGINATVTENLDNLGVSFTPYSYSILQGRDVSDALTNILGSGTNRIIIASDNEAFVNDAIRNLSQLVFRKHEIILYSSSRIRSFNTIDVENFHSVKLHASLSYYIDYDDPKVRQFLLEYRALFNTEPTRFAFQGYDLAKYFIASVAKYGNKWIKYLSNRDEDTLLHTKFLFAKQKDGGFANHGIHRVIYEQDYRIIMAD